MRYAIAFPRCRTRNAQPISAFWLLHCCSGEIWTWAGTRSRSWTPAVTPNSTATWCTTMRTSSPSSTSPRRLLSVRPAIKLSCAPMAVRSVLNVQWNLSLAHTELIKEELIKGHPDIVIFVAKAKQLDTLQNKENLLFLKEVLQFIRYASTRPFV